MRIDSGHKDLIPRIFQAKLEKVYEENIEVVSFSMVMANWKLISQMKLIWIRNL